MPLQLRELIRGLGMYRAISQCAENHWGLCLVAPKRRQSDGMLSLLIPQTLSRHQLEDRALQGNTLFHGHLRLRGCLQHWRGLRHGHCWR